MTAYRFVTLDCDRCGISFAPDGVMYVGLARHIAKEHGWTLRWGTDRRRKDWCPTCSTRAAT